MKKITVLVLMDRIACFYSLYPFLLLGNTKRFVFTASTEYCLKRDKNKVLVMVRRFIKPDYVDLPLMEKLRQKYRAIAFFHDDAGGGIPRLEVLPYVDLFYTKALFKDRSLYTGSLYGKELYSDYYHRNYGVNDDNPRERPVLEDLRQLNKLRLSWNIGIGDFPREQLRQRAGTLAAKLLGIRVARRFYSRKKLPADPLGSNTGSIAVHARIGLANRPSIAYQRKLILSKIEGDRRFLTGETGQKRYNRELSDSRIVLSPFGWGELCVRDFEAVRAGALLLKPDMDHLETWPDIFVKGKTYASFSWDGEDLLSTVDAYLDNEGMRRKTIRNAFDAYRSQLEELSSRFEKIIAEIESRSE
jgi:hypothetical protein